MSKTFWVPDHSYDWWTWVEMKQNAQDAMEKQMSASKYAELAAADWIDLKEAWKINEKFAQERKQIDQLHDNELKEQLLATLEQKKEAISSMIVDQIIAEASKKSDIFKWKATINEDGTIMYDEDNAIQDPQNWLTKLWAGIEEMIESDTPLLTADLNSLRIIAWIKKENIVNAYNSLKPAEVERIAREELSRAKQESAKQSMAMKVWAWDFDWITWKWGKTSMEYEVRTAHALRKARWNGTITKLAAENAAAKVNREVAKKDAKVLAELEKSRIEATDFADMRTSSQAAADNAMLAKNQAEEIDAFGWSWADSNKMAKKPDSKQAVKSNVAAHQNSGESLGTDTEMTAASNEVGKDGLSDDVRKRVSESGGKIYIEWWKIKYKTSHGRTRLFTIKNPENKIKATQVTDGKWDKITAKMKTGDENITLNQWIAVCERDKK